MIRQCRSTSNEIVEKCASNVDCRMKFTTRREFEGTRTRERERRRPELEKRIMPCHARGERKSFFINPRDAHQSLGRVDHRTNKPYLSDTRTSRDTRIPRLLAPVSVAVYIPLTDAAILQIIADR